MSKVLPFRTLAADEAVESVARHRPPAPALRSPGIAAFQIADTTNATVPERMRRYARMDRRARAARRLALAVIVALAVSALFWALVAIVEGLL